MKAKAKKAGRTWSVSGTVCSCGCGRFMKDKGWPRGWNNGAQVRAVFTQLPPPKRRAKR